MTLHDLQSIQGRYRFLYNDETTLIHVGVIDPATGVIADKGPIAMNSALPTGAATAALQTILNTLLAVGEGVMASAQAVTLATDDTQIGTIGDAADTDGNLHGQLRYANDVLDTIDADTGAIKDDLAELTSAPVAKVPVSIVKALDGSDPTALAASETYVTSFAVEAARADAVNTGDVFIGLVADLVSGTKNYFRLTPGKTFDYTCRAGTKVNLALWGIDGETATDGVVGVYEPV